MALARLTDYVTKEPIDPANVTVFVLNRPMVPGADPVWVPIVFRNW